MRSKHDLVPDLIALAVGVGLVIAAALTGILLLGVAGGALGLFACWAVDEDLRHRRADRAAYTVYLVPAHRRRSVGPPGTR